MNCTPQKTFNVSPDTYNELKKAEEKAIAALGLLEDVINPAFGDLRCDGLLGTKEESRGKHAVDWMEKNFNALYAASYAARNLVESVADTLQILPMREEVTQNG